MQIMLTMQPEKPLIIPLNYNYQLQSALYAMLGEVGESDFWHDNGFGEIAKYKGFCFGKLEGKYRIDKGNIKIHFENHIYLEVRSAVFEFIDAFQRAIERHPFITLYDTRIDIIGASLSNLHLTDKITTFSLVTPTVIHQGLEDGHTRYFSPEEDEFYIRLCNNLKKKYETITGHPADEIALRPTGEFRKTVTKYKNFYITGYTGQMDAKSSLKILEFLYNTGLGEKNSQGFGFVKVFGGNEK